MGIEESLSRIWGTSGTFQSYSNHVAKLMAFPAYEWLALSRHSQVSSVFLPSWSHVPHSFINFSIYVCGLWSSFSSSLPSCTLLHSCFPVWTTHAPLYFGDCSPHSCCFPPSSSYLRCSSISIFWTWLPNLFFHFLHSPSNSTLMVCLVGHSSLPSVKSGEINTGINLLGIFLFTFP